MFLNIKNLTLKRIKWFIILYFSSLLVMLAFSGLSHWLIHLIGNSSL